MCRKTKSPAVSRRAFRLWTESDFANVRRRRALLAFHDFELHALTLGERTEAVRLNGGVVHEHFRAVLTRDEAIALCIVEPLHCSLRHLATTFRRRSDFPKLPVRTYLCCLHRTTAVRLDRARHQHGVHAARKLANQRGECKKVDVPPRDFRL